MVDGNLPRFQTNSEQPPAIVRSIVPLKKEITPYLVASREQKATAVAASANFNVASAGQGSEPALGDHIFT